MGPRCHPHLCCILPCIYSYGYGSQPIRCAGHTYVRSVASTREKDPWQSWYKSWSGRLVFVDIVFAHQTSARFMNYDMPWQTLINGYLTNWLKGSSIAKGACLRRQRFTIANCFVVEEAGTLSFPPSPLQASLPVVWQQPTMISGQETWQGSFSAVSQPNFARKYLLESSRRDLHNARLCTVL